MQEYESTRVLAQAAKWGNETPELNQPWQEITQSNVPATLEALIHGLDSAQGEISSSILTAGTEIWERIAELGEMMEPFLQGRDTARDFRVNFGVANDLLNGATRTYATLARSEVITQKEVRDNAQDANKELEELFVEKLLALQTMLNKRLDEISAQLAAHQNELDSSREILMDTPEALPALSQLQPKFDEKMATLSVERDSILHLIQVVNYGFQSWFSSYVDDTFKEAAGQIVASTIITNAPVLEYSGSDKIAA